MLPSDYKNTVYKIVLLNGGETEYEQVLKTYYATEDNAVKKFAFTLGAAPSPALKQRTLDWAVKSGDVKTQVGFIYHRSHCYFMKVMSILRVMCTLDPTTHTGLFLSDLQHRPPCVGLLQGQLRVHQGEAGKGVAVTDGRHDHLLDE